MNRITASRASAILFAFLRQKLRNASNGSSFLIPAAICPVVPLVFAKLGVPVTYYDCASNSLLPDEDELVALVAADAHRFAGLLYCGAFGHLPDTRGVYRQLRDINPDITIIEDRCLARPQWLPEHQPEHVDLVLYSTGYGKYVDLGHGGFGFSRSPIDVAEAQLPYSEAAWRDIEQRAKHALATKTRFVYEDTAWLCTEPLGMNESSYFERVAVECDRMERHKSLLNHEYVSKLPAHFCLPQSFQHWRFTLSLDDPVRVLDSITAAGLFASRHFQPLDGVFSATETCPNSHLHYQRVLNLFNDRYFTLEQARATCDVIRNALLQ